jgi:hypothetical protein
MQHRFARSHLSLERDTRFELVTQAWETEFRSENNGIRETETANPTPRDGVPARSPGCCPNVVSELDDAVAADAALAAYLRVRAVQIASRLTVGMQVART